MYELIAAGVLLLLISVWLMIDNLRLTSTEYTLAVSDLPKSFSGFRIAQVSDLHNSDFGKADGALLTLLREAQPDCIFITGDLIDSYREDSELALRFAADAASVAPTYYVTGNHEARLADTDRLLERLRAAGVTVLRNETVLLERDGEAVTLIGLDDPAFGTNPAEVLQQLVPKTGCSLVLSHHPEFFRAYCDAGANAVFSGHAHGGQVRLPWIGGLIAPGQGLFPKYDAGVFQQGDTVMVVSRGIGQSLFPFRVNDPPELVIAALIPKETDYQ